MKKYTYIVVLFLFFLPLTALISNASDVHISLSKSTRNIPILISNFLSNEALPDKDTDLSKKIPEIIREDLQFSTIFKVFRGTPYQGEDYQVLESLGIDALLKGTYDVKGNDIVIESFLIDAQSGQKIMEVKYKGEYGDLRSIVHKISDEIVLRFTGEKGIAHSKLAFVYNRGKTKDVYIADYDGYNIKRLTNDNSIAVLPRWSSDGTDVLYTSYKNVNPNLYSISLNGENFKRISSLPGLNMGVSFSPKGKYFTLTLTRDGNPEIYIMSKTGKIIRRLTNSNSIDVSPSWSPNGREIAFVSDRTGYPQIYVMDIEGTNLRRLTYDGYHNTSPSWSPKGDKIAYASRNKGVLDIYVMNSDGSNPLKLTSNTKDNENPSWSPDSRHVVFASNRNGTYQIYVMNADGTGQKKLIALDNDCSSPSWSP